MAGCSYLADGGVTLKIAPSPLLYTKVIHRDAKSNTHFFSKKYKDSYPQGILPKRDTLPYYLKLKYVIIKNKSY